MIRLGRELPRYLLCTMAIVGLVASARFAIAPPRTSLPRTGRDIYQPELAARGFALLFARRYLTWSSADPEAHREALEPFIGPGIEPEAGMQVPSSGEQQVEWAEAVQERELGPDEHVYTVAAQTDTAGVLYLTVSVLRKPDGSVALAGYPAFVGAPASSPGDADGMRAEVDDPELATVVRRGLSNYLAGSSAELEADLAEGADVSLPSEGLALESVQHLEWALGPGAVIALVQARDRRGAQYTLGYELDVERTAGRWEISAIQMSADA